jgi:salicylate hydroxylase
MNGRSIAIAGCGPCGLASALLLTRAGNRIVVFERFAEPQPIGSGLMIQHTGLAVLRQLGLAEQIVGEGARIERLHGMAGKRVVLSVGYEALKAKPAMFGIGIHRASLFAALHDALQVKGIELRTGHAITGSSMKGGRRCLHFADGRISEPFDLIVDALGTRSTLAPGDCGELPFGALWASLDWPEDLALPGDTLSQHYRRSSVMAGVLPLGRGRESRNRLAFFWSLKGSDHARWQDAGLEKWKAQVRDLWPECEPVLGQISDSAQFVFARYAHRTLERPAEEAMIHIGDAWHSASPQLGQGANMALLDAWALSVAMARNSDIATALRDAVDLRRGHVEIYQWLTWLFTPVYQSDSRVLPFVRDRLVGPLSRLWPANKIQAAMVAGLVANPLPGLGLTDA